MSIIATAIPGTSRFFMSYVLLKAIGGAASAMSGMITSVIYVLKKKFLGKTPRGESNCWAAKAYPLGVQGADVLLMFMIVNIFTTLQPIMHVIGFLYFVPRFVVAKVQIFYLHEVKFEGYGAMWPVLRGRMVVALILYQITMIVTIALKLGAPQAVLLGVLVTPGTYLFKRVMDAKYNSVIAGVIPLEVFATKEFKAAEQRAPDEVLPFLHPALRPEDPKQLVRVGLPRARASATPLLRVQPCRAVCTLFENRSGGTRVRSAHALRACIDAARCMVCATVLTVPPLPTAHPSCKRGSSRRASVRRSSRTSFPPRRRPLRTPPTPEMNGTRGKARRARPRRWPGPREWIRRWCRRRTWRSRRRRSRGRRRVRRPLAAVSRRPPAPFLLISSLSVHLLRSPAFRCCCAVVALQSATVNEIIAQSCGS